MFEFVTFYAEASNTHGVGVFGSGMFFKLGLFMDVIFQNVFGKPF